MNNYNIFSGNANLLFSSDLVSLMSGRANFALHLSFEHPKGPVELVYDTLWQSFCVSSLTEQGFIVLLHL
jgi:hypothetical protein